MRLYNFLYHNFAILPLALVQPMRDKAQVINPDIKAYLAAIGSKGGKTVGKSKARTKEQARAAAAARWKGHKAKRPSRK